VHGRRPAEAVTAAREDVDDVHLDRWVRA
jgi:hypothetical protein